MNGAHRWIKVAPPDLPGCQDRGGNFYRLTMWFAVPKRCERTGKAYCPGGVMALTVGFIVAEPDLGATVVIVLMMVGVFFLAGAPATQFLIMLGAIVAGVTALILFEPFRFQRLISFTNPWADPLGVGCPFPLR